MKKKEVKTVVVKIRKNEVGFYELSEVGKQVVMDDKDENYIKKAFTQMEKAQERLKKYFKD